MLTLLIPNIEYSPITLDFKNSPFIFEVFRLNVYQRIVLVVGAIVFVIALLTAPQIKKAQGGIILKAKEGNTMYASIMDVHTAAVRGFAVLGATIMLYFAAKGIKKKK